MLRQSLLLSQEGDERLTVKQGVLVLGFSIQVIGIQPTLAHFVRQERLLLTGVSFAVMPHVKKQIRGPIWFQLLVGLPPVMIFSVGCAGLAGGFLLFSCPKSGVRERELN
jgi:hypothetical protein